MSSCRALQTVAIASFALAITSCCCQRPSQEGSLNARACPPRSIAADIVLNSSAYEVKHVPLAGTDAFFTTRSGGLAPCRVDLHQEGEVVYSFRSDENGSFLIRDSHLYFSEVDAQLPLWPGNALVTCVDLSARRVVWTTPLIFSPPASRTCNMESTVRLSGAIGNVLHAHVCTGGVAGVVRLDGETGSVVKP